MTSAKKINLSKEDVGKLIIVSKKGNNDSNSKIIEHKGYIVDISDDLIQIKLIDNGYNIGIKKENIEKIEFLDSKIEIGKPPSITIKQNSKLPSVCYIATGGTIGTHVDYKTGGVFMCRSPEEVLATTPEIIDIVNISKVESPFTKASEDMDYKDWKIIAKTVYQQLLDKEINGIIVTHGTDTLTWTSSALSFMLPNVNKPILFVGAQRSPDRASFDGAMNLVCASHFIKENIPGVFIVMHGSINDDYCFVIRATKCKKMHTSRRDSFRPINDLPIAKVYFDGRIEYLKDKKEIAKLPLEKPKIIDSWCEKVGIVKAYPNSDPSIIDWYISKGYKGLVIEGTALGHVPSEDSNNSWLPYIKKANDSGIVVIMTSQCLYGRVNDKVYRNLRNAATSGADYLEQHDMLPEVAFIKLSIILGQTTDKKKVIEYMKTSIAWEISDKETPEMFLY
ncbi:MAG: Glu-tRNA(Gln) amidotransferase subunit GatD [archaeon]